MPYPDGVPVPAERRNRAESVRPHSCLELVRTPIAVRWHRILRRVRIGRIAVSAPFAVAGGE